jgi:tetratricopeptide (TPR) repeat protein
MAAFTQVTEGADPILLGAAWTGIGDLHRRAEDWPKAEEAYRHATAFGAPEAALGLAELLFTRGDVAEARQVIDRVILEGEAPWPAVAGAVAAGALLGRNEDAEAAAAYARRAIETDDPTWSYAGRFWLAQALIALDRHDEARTSLRECVDDGPEPWATRARQALGALDDGGEDAAAST